MISTYINHPLPYFQMVGWGLFHHHLCKGTKNRGRVMKEAGVKVCKERGRRERGREEYLTSGEVGRGRKV